MRKIISVLLVTAMILTMMVPIRAKFDYKINKNHTVCEVRTFEELKAAVARSDNSLGIKVMNDITIEETLIIEDETYIYSDKRAAKKPVLKAGNLKMDSAIGSNMFYVKSNEKKKHFYMYNIDLDGDKKARIIYMEGYPSDRQNTRLFTQDVNFKNGPTLLFEESTDGVQNYSGAAIFAKDSWVEINGGEFINNRIKPAPANSQAKPSEGGAISLVNVVFIINDRNVPKPTKESARTKFRDNGLGDGYENTEGIDGGDIACNDTSNTGYIGVFGASFEISRPFNSGGSIKLKNCGGSYISRLYFEIKNDLGELGQSGGVIAAEDSNFDLSLSTLKAGEGTRVRDYGGFVYVSGKGKVDFQSLSFEGLGVDLNSPKYIAKTGGAIAFEDGSEQDGKIYYDVIIKDCMVEDKGAGIAFGTSDHGSSKINLDIIDTEIINTAAYKTDGSSYAGGMYIGKGNKIIVEYAELSGCYSNIAGGIYNLGDLEITGDAKITGNKAQKMVGGIYHAGTRLKIDEATVDGNSVDESHHILNDQELSGINIYAASDLIITPNAKLGEDDIRILDGESRILLAGPLANKINVSISEKQKASSSEDSIEKIFAEDQYRKVGYVIASGATEGKILYIPTVEDAQKLHYASKAYDPSKEASDDNQPIADEDDHTSLGKWDFILNPEKKDIVLGQRGKVKFDPNGTESSPAHHNGMDDGVIREEVYQIYSPSAIIPKIEPPIRKGYVFTGWYLEQNVNDDEEDVGKTGKTLVKNLADIRGNDDEITTILDPNIFTLYAGWEKEKSYDPGYWYEPSPDYLNKKTEAKERTFDLYRWYVKGNEGDFMPFKGITRAEIAEIFARALDYDKRYFDDSHVNYPDVDANAWYAKAVARVTNAGIFKGTDEGNFEPTREITQGELISTLKRFQKLNDSMENIMTMRDDHWARAEVNAAAKEGWLKIYQDGTKAFDVDKVITREEVVAIANKAFARPVDQKYVDEYIDSLKTFKDIDKDMWSYYEILTAANTYFVNYDKKDSRYDLWVNHATFDDGPTTAIEDIKTYKEILNNDEYKTKVDQVRFERDLYR